MSLLTEEYNLVDEPFTLSPDPTYLCLTNQHRTAFTKCKYTLETRGGLAVVYGDVGTGKTTLSRRLYSALKGDTGYIVALLVTADLKSHAAFLRAILDEFNIPAHKSHAANIKAFQEYATSAYQEDKSIVLIVDEAQQLTPKMMEVIRLMLNFETDSQKFVQVVLFGQNELATKLDHKRLAAIKSRVSTFGALSGLTPEETASVIDYRWKAAGGDTAPFTAAAVTAIHRYSGGLPRLINKLCTHGLLAALGAEPKIVTEQMIMEAAPEVRLTAGDK